MPKTQKGKPQGLSLVLPKGSLEEQTLLLFKQAGLEVRGADRSYDGTVRDPRIARVKVLRPQEIPNFVAQGHFDLGISGLDWVKESGLDLVKPGEARRLPAPGKGLVEVADLGYSKGGPGPVRVVLAVPQAWGVKSPRKLRRGARISTEYPALTRAYFERLGVPAEVVFSYGATEGKVPDLADGVVDVTETGTTLRKAGLRIVETLVESTALLLANPEAWRGKRRAILELRTLLLGVVEARGKVLLVMNVPADRLERVIRALPAMKRPTVSPLYEPGRKGEADFYAVETVVPREGVNLLLPRLKAAGAQDILELGIDKIVK
jgi:ATP phosphoribosyltransferase